MEIAEKIEEDSERTCILRTHRVTYVSESTRRERLNTFIHEIFSEEYAMRSNNSLAWMMFQNGAFEIFGEVDEDDKIG